MLRKSLPELIVLLLAGILIFYNLGANSMFSQNEAGHALVAREMAESGDWLTLQYKGEPYFKKSPLKFWLTATTYTLFGVNEWTARIWSGLFAFGTIVILMFGGNWLFGPRTGTIAAFVMATTHQFLYKHCARTGDLDSSLLFFFTASMLLLVAAVEGRSHRFLYLSFLTIGLSGLVKHLGAIPELLLITALYITATGRWRIFSGRAWLLAFSVSLLVVLPWTLYQLTLHGNEFLSIHFGRELIQRATEGLPGSQQSRLGAWFYPNTFKNGMFPWSLLLPFALWGSVVRVPAEARKRNLSLLIWIAVIFIVPMFSTGQAFRYILPAYPAVALLIGLLLNRLGRRPVDTFAYVSVGIGTLVALVSTTTALKLNPFKPNQKKVMLKADLFDRLEGSFLDPSTLGLVIVVGLLGWILWRYRSRVSAQWSISAFLMTVALIQVAPALRFSTTRLAIDRAVSATLLTREPDEIVWTVLTSRQSEVTTDEFYVRQLEPRVAHLNSNPNSIVRRAQDGVSSMLVLTTKKFTQALEKDPWISENASVTRVARSGSFTVVRVSKKTQAAP